MTYITSSCNIFEREWIFKLPSNPLLLISFPWLVVSPFVSLIHMMKERLGFELMLVWITGFGCLLLICFDIEFSRGSFLFFIHWHNPNTWAMLMDMGLSWAYLSTHTCWFDNGLTFWALFRLVPAARLRFLGIVSWFMCCFEDPTGTEFKVYLHGQWANLNGS